MAIVGKVAEWNDLKGYGFITVENQATRIFFHITDVSGRAQRPRINERVQFSLAKDSSGGLRAVKVERPIVFNFSMAIVIWFSTIMVSSVWLFDYPVIILLYYLMASAVTYSLYGYDKTAEATGGWRVPETLLHVISVMGGWPGAILAQSILQHKSRVPVFMFIFWLTLLINFLLFCWTLTPQGELELQVFIQKAIAFSHFY
ncbi:DUF1294 domain-containing protein [Vibrio sp. SCSIO 43135]|uniref:DUF1294 domain-containing protein n=1 Tax=Vibrio sp. SCSIO 43135 TaxID=2819096 RepID=UPI0020759000|nr:DUF1294 domain-containing protein [Vibrio sp. SCSIO 43135]USD42919.1 DUF1294 domain-containing protein [Vibrio sp. SCSIO 43135]